MNVIFMVFLLAVSGIFTTQLSASSEPIATAIARPGDDSDRIDLFAEQATCPENTKRALFTYRIGAPRLLGSTKVEGCWTLVDQNIYMAFEDGDRGALAVRAFTWASGKPPQPPM